MKSAAHDAPVVPRKDRRASRRTAVKKRFGNETPRLWTPPLRDISQEFDAFGRVTTRGYEAIRFSEEVLGIGLLPWQRWLLIHALELNQDGTFRFRIIVLLVARQNGKSTLMQVLSLWRLFVDGAPLVLGTAQTLDIAEALWEETVDLAESIPELAGEVAKVDRTNGKKALRIESEWEDEDGRLRKLKQAYRVKAATRRGARGLSGDLVLLDELREHQVWDAWASVTKTTMARAFAQIWGASNAGDASSVVLRYLRAIGHKSLGYPDGRDGIAEGLRLLEAFANGEAVDDDDADAAMKQSAAEGMEEALATLGLFEWSAAPHRSVWDRDGWQEANPSMGYTILESTVASAAATDPEHVFRTEVLCQFVAHAATGPFPAGSWQGTLQHVNERQARGVIRDTTRPVTYCVDVSHSRLMSYVAVAFWDTEGRIRFEVVAQRAGTDWIVPWLTSGDRRIPVDHLTVQSKGAPVSSLLQELEDAELVVSLWEGSLLAQWYGQFFDLIAASVHPEDPAVKITHGSQPILDLAATSAVTKKLGGDGLFIDRAASPRDVAPLLACVGAVGLLLTDPEAGESVYEENELMVV